MEENLDCHDSRTLLSAGFEEEKSPDLASVIV